MKLEFEIISHSRVGEIEFGMTPTQISQIMQSKFKEYYPYKSKLPALSYGSLGVQVFFKEPGVYNLVQLSLPASPTFRGKSLLKSSSISSLKIWLEQQGMASVVVPDKCGLMIASAGISLYTEDYDLLCKKRPTSVSVFERGYWD